VSLVHGVYDDEITRKLDGFITIPTIAIMSWWAFEMIFHKGFPWDYDPQRKYVVPPTR
jgi:hypothetical protein